MAEWDARFTKAATWQLARQVQVHLGERETPSGAEPHQWADRCAWLAEHLLAYKSLDARSITSNMIQSLDSAVAQWAGYIATWRSGQGDNYLSAAGTQGCDAVLEVLRSWPQARKDRATKAMVEASEQYAAATFTAQEQFDLAVERATERLNEVMAEVNSAALTNRDELSSLASEVARIDGVVARAGERLSMALTSQMERYDEEEGRRAEVHADAEAALAEAGRQAVAKVAAEAAEAARVAASQAQERLEVLGSLERQAAELVGVISVEGTATGYGAYARQERRAAWGWSLSAVVVALGGFAVVLWALHGVEATTSWRETVIKVLASLTLGGVATYCGNQSSQHRQQERTAKRMELDLAALNPFINNLAPEQQDRVRSAVADRMFLTSEAGTASPPTNTAATHPSSGNPSASPAVNTEALTKAIVLIQDVLKTRGS